MRVISAPYAAVPYAAAFALISVGCWIGSARSAAAGHELEALQFAHPGLSAQAELVPGSVTDRTTDLAQLVRHPDHAMLDRSTGRWATLLPSEPMFPGSGRGNSLAWAAELGRSAPPHSDVGTAEIAERTFLAYLEVNADALRISLDEIARPLDVSVDGETTLVHARRVVDGVPVRRSSLNATISHGNLVLLGAARWGDVEVATRPSFEAPERALEPILTQVSNRAALPWGETELVLLPFRDGPVLSYRLAYSLKRSFADHPGRWEALVDAHDGEVLAFRDTNRSARHVVGGVYPLTNDGIGDEGQEQPRWPMPYADLNEGLRFANRNGRMPGNFAGEVTTTLSGLYVDVTDECGAIEESSTGPNVDLDLGVSDGTNCTNPPGTSPGNTAAARTAYYEANRIAEWARSRLPGNAWLRNTLPVVTNIQISCGGIWNGTELRLFHGNFGCANTGELAGVIDHEWGHGLDDNDNDGSISFPGEGIADAYAALRQNESCLARGFLEAGGQCNGYGDPCTDCPGGIRDIDWANHESGAPHDIAWAEANCGGCGNFGTPQCLGLITSESIWDLATRDLQSQLGAEDNQALELATRLTLLGAQNVGDWFSCNADGEDGCAAENGYMNFLAVDDDDGDLTNGTPHMTALFAAFDRHGAACSIPVVQNRGCEAMPTEAPTVTAAVVPGRAGLRWDSVPGAERYHVYRTEGTRACAKGKIFLGATTATTWVDSGLLPNFDYYYTVAAVGGGRSCLGPMSDCVGATPPAIGDDSLPRAE